MKNDDFEWHTPHKKVDYSLDISRPGDLICEKSILEECIAKSEIPPPEYLYVVDSFRKLVNVSTNKIIDFDDKTYIRIAGLMFKEDDQEPTNRPERP